jgi:predicted peroxiredoxin
LGEAVIPFDKESGMAKKFLFTISHSTSSPMEAIGILKIASNMKAYEDDAQIIVFLIGEGVQLAKKSIAASISMELEGNMANVGDMIEMAVETGIKFYVCHGFMPGFGVEHGDLTEGFEAKSSAYLGELLLEGYVPFSVSI